MIIPAMPPDTPIFSLLCLLPHLHIPAAHSAGVTARPCDSRAEWVRCMKLTNTSQLYLSTNQGCLHRLHLTVDNCSSSSSRSSSNQPAWRLLYSSPSKAAITCMQIIGTDIAPPTLLHSRHASITAAGSHVVGAQARDHHWVVFGDGVGVATCLAAQHSASPQTRDIGASGHRPNGLGQPQEPQPSPALMQEDTATPSAPNPSSRQDSGAAEGASQQPERLADPSCAPPLPPHLSWVAHQGSPVLAIFHPSSFGSRHVFTTSIAGTPMRWWLLPEHTSSSATAGQVAVTQTQNLAQVKHVTQDLSQSEYATQDPALSEHAAHPAGKVAATALDQAFSPPLTASSNPLFHPQTHPPLLSQTAPLHESKQPCNPSTSSATAEAEAATADEHDALEYGPSSTPGGQVSTGTVGPRLLAEVAPIPGRGSQIVAMDACWARQLLVCGDMAGNVMAFRIPTLLLQGSTPGVYF